MNTLNYWLGRLQSLQLFGRGQFEVEVRLSSGDATFRIVDVVADSGKVIVVIV